MFKSRGPHSDRPVAQADLLATYRPVSQRVQDAYRRMLAISSSPHQPAEARAAADELTRALLTATASAGRALQLLHPAPAARFWSAELVRLSGLGVWLRRQTLDDLGVHVPTAVRVGSRAATRPHVAGLVAEPADLVAATLHQPCIGVDLQAVVDGEQPGTTQAATSSPGHLSKAA